MIAPEMGRDSSRIALLHCCLLNQLKQIAISLICTIITVMWTSGNCFELWERTSLKMYLINKSKMMFLTVHFFIEHIWTYHPFLNIKQNYFSQILQRCCNYFVLTSRCSTSRDLLPLSGAFPRFTDAPGCAHLERGTSTEICWRRSINNSRPRSERRS